MPKTLELTALIDNYCELRDTRLAAQREVDQIARQETEAKQTLIKALQSQELSAAASAKYLVKYKLEDKPIASNWDDIYRYIQDTGSFDLLQRRLLESAVKARWEDDEELPGITTYPVDKLTVSKT